MLVITLLITIVAIALRSLYHVSESNWSTNGSQGSSLDSSLSDPNENEISPLLFSRYASIALLFSAYLSYNVLYLDILPNSIGIFSGIFVVTPISLSIEIFVFVMASTILMGWFIWPNVIKSLTNKSIISHYSGAKTVYDSNIRLEGPILAEYPLILLFSILGGTLLVSSNDLIAIYLSIELQSFAVYILATLYKDSEEATSAGLKYFLLGGLSSCIILLGAALIYSYTGLTNLESIFNLLLTVNSLSDVIIIPMIGMLLIITGLLFKIAAAPLHNWAIDVYSQVPTIVTTWLIIMPKITIVLFLLQFVSLALVHIPSFEGLGVIKYIFIVSALFSLVIGSLVGLAQYRIKRLLAYSTVSHVGFLLLALGVSSEMSTESLLFYITQYSVTNLNVFLILLAFSYTMRTKVLEKANGSSDKWVINSHDSDINYIYELKGQFKENPLLALSLGISLFSLAGIPPLLGFYAKQQILYTTIQNGYYFMSIVAIIVSVISASYYLQIIKVMHFSAQTSVNPVEGITASDETDSNSSSYKVINESYISSVHSTLIAISTLMIMLFIFNPLLAYNAVQLLAYSLYPY